MVILSNLSPGRTAIHPMQSFIFLANGSGAVVMNSYVPSRKSKKIFGEYFYTALLNGQTGPIAYRTALLGMIRNREFASPGRWGEFFMWGTR